MARYPNLEAELKRHDITRDELAKKLGIAKSTVQRKLDGTSEFSVKEASMIASIIGTNNILMLFEVNSDNQRN